MGISDPALKPIRILARSGGDCCHGLGPSFKQSMDSQTAERFSLLPFSLAGRKEIQLTKRIAL